jgi:hypothetical protein
VLVRLLVLAILGLSLSGCAAAALPAVGLAAMSGTASTAAKVGVEHTIGGRVARTFAVPLADVRAAVRESFGELRLTVTRDELLTDETAVIEAEARQREIEVSLEPVSPALTRLTIVVKQGWLGRDVTTAGELIAQTSHVLDVRSGASASPRAP